MVHGAYFFKAPITTVEPSTKLNLGIENNKKFFFLYISKQSQYIFQTSIYRKRGFSLSFPNQLTKQSLYDKEKDNRSNSSNSNVLEW